MKKNYRHNKKLTCKLLCSVFCFSCTFIQQTDYLGDDLPPPPPPLDLTQAGLGTADYVQCNVNTSFPPPPEDLPPPPSPVSSSYSELRRATDTGYPPMGQDYGGYTMGSQVPTFKSAHYPSEITRYLFL